MIIWSGRGILIPVFAVLGVLAGSMAGGIPLVVLKADPGTYGKWTTVFSMLGAALALWIFAKTIGKTKEQVFVDPQTRQHVAVTTRHTLFFLPPTFWAVVASLMTLAFVFMPTPKGGTPRAKVGGAASSQGTAAFRDADDLLIGRSKGLVHGNNPAAIAFAEAFSKTLKDARNGGIEKNTGKSIVSLTKGDFLTYCLLTRQRCVFMVHVPDLRKFTSDAKDFLSEAAWLIAVKIVDEAGVHPKTIAVGLRGSLFYDRVIVGHPGQIDAYQSLIERTLQGNDDSRAELALQFDAVSKDAQPEAVAKVDEAGVETPAGTVETESPAKAAVSSLPESPSPPERSTTSSMPRPKPETPPETAPVPAVPAPASTASTPASSAPSPTAPAAAEKKMEPLTEMRAWKDATGRTMQAAFVRFATADRTTAEFKREDGQVFTIPLERLSVGDQIFVLRHPDLSK